MKKLFISLLIFFVCILPLEAQITRIPGSLTADYYRAISDDVLKALKEGNDAEIHRLLIYEGDNSYRLRVIETIESLSPKIQAHVFELALSQDEIWPTPLAGSENRVIQRVFRDTAKEQLSKLLPGEFKYDLREAKDRAVIRERLSKEVLLVKETVPLAAVSQPSPREASNPAAPEAVKARELPKTVAPTPASVEVWDNKWSLALWLFCIVTALGGIFLLLRKGPR